MTTHYFNLYHIKRENEKYQAKENQVNVAASNMSTLTSQSISLPPLQRDTNERITSLNILQFNDDPQYLNFFIYQTQKSAELCRWLEDKSIFEVKNSLTGKAKDFLVQTDEVESISSTADLFDRLTKFFKPKATRQEYQEWEKLYVRE